MALILVLHNDGTGKNNIGHYNCEVLIGDGTPAGSRIIQKTRIERHDRADGWKALVQRLLDESGDD